MVQDSYLQQVHPEFLRRYRDDYTTSLRSLADSMRTNNQIEGVIAAVKYDGFCDWMHKHSAELKFP